MGVLKMLSIRRCFVLGLVRWISSSALKSQSETRVAGCRCKTGRELETRCVTTGWIGAAI